jgi:hypothetical protein
VNNVTQYGTGRRAVAETGAASIRPSIKSNNSAMRIDLALLLSSLFLQRFSLPFGKAFLPIDFIFAALIFAHQFAVGRVFINYDRLLCFLVMLVATGLSLLLNFTSMTSYGLFVLSYSVHVQPFFHPRSIQEYPSMLSIACVDSFLLCNISIRRPVRNQWQTAYYVFWDHSRFLL